jgi:hypothetical protein
MSLDRYLQISLISGKREFAFCADAATGILALTSGMISFVSIIKFYRNDHAGATEG